MVRSDIENVVFIRFKRVRFIKLPSGAKSLIGLSRIAKDVSLSCLFQTDKVGYFKIIGMQLR